MHKQVYGLCISRKVGVDMSPSPAKRNFNISIESDNADFIKRNGVNLSRAVDTLIRDMRRVKEREEWSQENQVALEERYRLLNSEGGTAAERLYGVLSAQEA
jgi:post-segregation antitoxin (ccd killing protein)